MYIYITLFRTFLNNNLKIFELNIFSYIFIYIYEEKVTKFIISVYCQ